MDKEQREWIRRQQFIDQQTEEAVQNLPNLWFRMYVKMQEEGFEKAEAMSLLFHFVALTHRD